MTAFHIIPILHADILQNSLPTKTTKRSYLMGCFLAGRERVQEEVEKAESQGKLF